MSDMQIDSQQAPPFTLPLAAQGTTAASQEVVAALMARFSPLGKVQASPGTPKDTKMPYSPAPGKIRIPVATSLVPKSIWEVLKCPGSPKKTGDLANFTSMDWKDPMPASDNPRADSLKASREIVQQLIEDSGEEYPEAYRIEEPLEECELLPDDPFRLPDGSNKAERDALNYWDAVLQRRQFPCKPIHTYVHDPHGMKLNGVPLPTKRARTLFPSLVVSHLRSYNQVLDSVYDLAAHLHDALEAKHPLAVQSRHKLPAPLFQYLLAALLSEPVNKETTDKNATTLFETESQFALRDALGLLAFIVIDAQLYDKRAMIDGNVFQLFILAFSTPDIGTGYLPYLLPGTRSLMLMLMHRLSIDSLIETIGASAENLDAIWHLLNVQLASSIKSGQQLAFYNLPKIEIVRETQEVKIVPALKLKRVTKLIESDLGRLLWDKTRRETLPLSAKEAKAIFEDKEGKEVKIKTKTPVPQGLTDRLRFLGGEMFQDKASPCEYLLWGNMPYAYGMQFHLSYCYVNNCHPESIKTVPIELLKGDPDGFNLLANALAPLGLIICSQAMIESVKTTLDAKDAEIAQLKSEQQQPIDGSGLELINLRAQVAALTAKLESQSLTLQRAATEANLAKEQALDQLGNVKDLELARLSRENQSLNEQLITAREEVKTREEQYKNLETQMVNVTLPTLKDKMEVDFEAKVAELKAKMDAEFEAQLKSRLEELKPASDLETQLKRAQEHAEQLQNQLFDVQSTKHKLEHKLAALEERSRVVQQEMVADENKDSGSSQEPSKKVKGGKKKAKGGKKGRKIDEVYDKNDHPETGSPSKRQRVSKT